MDMESFEKVDANLSDADVEAFIALEAEKDVYVDRRASEYKALHRKGCPTSEYSCFSREFKAGAR